ncbi:GT2 family glycosyltransferase [Paenibacillus phyllosphaerae]|uniref:GT2 family glycosyltransferase n=1 Tax=Paenibacillus phyllosphaerae TaxID=274593 RepID=A0A7W5B3G4_9BACL|nr:glycosyltransferase family 2 protein [Paenibacillus phyllosphaerae]MBB3113633.1 GT2 family glycosyltransferase [Paenibacillus phyllosphaerae]
MHKTRHASKRPRRAAVRPVARRRSKPDASFRNGYERGYQAGVELGRLSFGAIFEGTSIIIPSYNQAGYLKGCIESIIEHTDLPYEIIVVDNASTDGTANYLRSLSGQVRYRIMETNRGFAGAVNVGLMMAKGQTIVLLNNDTLVTERWLDNMLTCLGSDPRIGMVGPVTNYIGGNQQIDVPYTAIEDMQEFARQFNQSDPAKWHLTDRLVGYCLLFRKELLERTGYLDEGFKIGNFEDDDYNIRVRLQGYMLVVARDTFIHHFGSVSVKALGEQFTAINDNNMSFYMAKWGNPHELVFRVRDLLNHDLANGGKWREPDSILARNGETAFYPDQVVVRGVQDTCYWIEAGVRRPISGQISIAPARLSQVELKRWPLGDKIEAGELNQRWQGTDPNSAAELHRPIEPLILHENQHFILEDGRRRAIVTIAALTTWGLYQRPVTELQPDVFASLPEGLPIIAPPLTADFL